MAYIRVYLFLTMTYIRFFLKIIICFCYNNSNKPTKIDPSSNWVRISPQGAIPAKYIDICFVGRGCDLRFFFQDA